MRPSLRFWRSSKTLPGRRAVAKASLLPIQSLQTATCRPFWSPQTIYSHALVQGYSAGYEPPAPATPITKYLFSPWAACNRFGGNHRFHLKSWLQSRRQSLSRRGPRAKHEHLDDFAQVNKSLPHSRSLATLCEHALGIWSPKPTQATTIHLQMAISVSPL